MTFEISAATDQHRRNIDGTWDSICLACFLTIARADVEANLASQEADHACVGIFGRCSKHSGDWEARHA